MSCLRCKKCRRKRALCMSLLDKNMAACSTTLLCHSHVLDVRGAVHRRWLCRYTQKHNERCAALKRIALHKLVTIFFQALYQPLAMLVGSSVIEEYTMLI